MILPTQGSSGSGGEAIGTIVPRYNSNFTTASEAKRYLFCDGSTYDTSKYPKLYAVLGTNKLPKLNDNRFLQGSTTGGTYKEAGLPNITGKITCMDGQNDSGNIEPLTIADHFENKGSLKIGDSTYTRSLDYGDDLTDFAMRSISFDASWSNAIYGKSSTVQPPAMTVRFYIRAK